MLEIAPSILSADFAHLARDLGQLEAGGADWVHVDVMDGHYVPNLTMGPPIIACMKRSTRLPLDCHLMLEKPERWIAEYRKAGAARITIHVEACVHLHRTIGAIRESGAKAGVAINPSTPVSALGEVIGELDLALVMSVNPGFSGQAFIERAYEKVRALAALAAATNPRLVIQVDGGVTADNIGRLRAAGAHSFVAASAIFGGGDPAGATRALRKAAEDAKIR